MTESNLSILCNCKKVSLFYSNHTVTIRWLECHNFKHLRAGHFYLTKSVKCLCCSFKSILIQFAALAPSMLPVKETGEQKHLWSDAFSASQTSAFCCLTQLIEVAEENKQKKKHQVIPFFRSTAGQCVFLFSQQANLPQPPLPLGGCRRCNFVWLCACAFGVFSFSPPCLCWTTARTDSKSPKTLPYNCRWTVAKNSDI